MFAYAYKQYKQHHCKVLGPCHIAWTTLTVEWLLTLPIPLPFTFTIAVNSAGPDDCIETITITTNNGVAHVLPGIVCFQCDFGSGVATDSTFTINSGPVDRIVGNTVRGVLVIFETDEVFGTSSLPVQCTSGDNTFTLITFLRSRCCGSVSFLLHNYYNSYYHCAPQCSFTLQSLRLPLYLVTQQ